jgi:hypothetical protein
LAGQGILAGPGPSLSYDGKTEMAKTLDLKLENIRCGPMPEKNTIQDVKLRRIVPGDMRREDMAIRRGDMAKEKAK